MERDRGDYDNREQARITRILNKLSQLYPEAGTALKYNNPFQLLIATILAAQCTDKRVNKVTERLFEKYKGPEDFAVADRRELEEDIRECGLSGIKARTS